MLDGSIVGQSGRKKRGAHGLHRKRSSTGARGRENKNALILDIDPLACTRERAHPVAS
jgi:hypothetical protein